MNKGWKWSGVLAVRGKNLEGCLTHARNEEASFLSSLSLRQILSNYMNQRRQDFSTSIRDSAGFFGVQLPLQNEF